MTKEPVLELQIKNWQQFQHYKNRNPPWIKLSTGLFQDYDFACLQDASKLLQIFLWTLASRYRDGIIRADFNFIRHQSGITNLKEEHLKELIDQGLIIASNLLAESLQDACIEKRQRRDREDKKEIKETTKEKKEKHEKFEEWWLQYPKLRRSYKPDALRAWGEATKKVSASILLEALIRYCESGEVKRGYMPYPAKWLRNERWNEDFTDDEKYAENNGVAAAKTTWQSEAKRLAAKYRAEAQQAGEGEIDVSPGPSLHPPEAIR